MLLIVAWRKSGRSSFRLQRKSALRFVSFVADG
jgi:hypothetical protein